MIILRLIAVGIVFAVAAAVALFVVGFLLWILFCFFGAILSVF